MTELSNLIAQLVAKGWPRDYCNVKAPCWYTFGVSNSPEPLEDPHYAPDLTGADGYLVIHPEPGRYFIHVHVRANGSLGFASVEVHDGQGLSADGFAGCVEADSTQRLQWLLPRAHRLYLEWELKQFEQEKNLAQLEEQRRAA